MIRAMGEWADRFKPRIPCPALVGREGALATLRERVDHMGEARPRVALIVGEAGSGKSRLADTLLAYAKGRGIRVLRCECLPDDRALPYGPILALLRAQLRALPSEEAAALVAPFARPLAALLPEWVPPGGAPLSAAQPADEARSLQQAAFTHCILGRTRGAPLLVIVEDLHWCDHESLDVLRLLLREAATPLLLVGTTRDEEPASALREWQSELTRRRLAVELHLQPLSPDEVRAMVGAILEDDADVHEACAAVIAPLAEGRPFYVEELLRALIDAGDLVPTDSGWAFTAPEEPRLPRTLEALLRQRVASLAADVQELLAMAAVLGRRFDQALLQQVVGVGEPELLRRIKPLIAAQLVVEEAPDQFGFRHALTREAIYGGLLARERRALHRAAAAAIEQLTAGGLEPHLAELAQHYARAEEWAKALAYAGWAGEQAQQRHAPRAAIALYSLALDAAARLRHATPPRARPLELAPAQLYLARGQAYAMVGQFEPAHADYATALLLAGQTGDNEAEWGALSSLGALWSEREYARAGDYWRRALELARTHGVTARVAHSLNRVGNWLVNVGRPDEAMALHAEALGMFETAQDNTGAAQTLDRLGMASFLAADLATSVRCYDRAVSLFEGLGDHYGLVSSLVMTMTTRAGTSFFDPVVEDGGAFPRARADGERALELARRLEWRAGESFALWTLGTLLAHYGVFGRALEVTRLGCSIAEEIGHTQWQASSQWTLGMIYLDLLAPRLARAALEQALALGRVTGSAVWTHHAAAALAVACHRGHDHAEAEALLALTVADGVPVAWSGQVALLWARVTVALGRREPDRALALLDEAGLLSEPGTPGRGTMRLLLARGETLAALGRLDEAELVLARLRDAAERQGARAPLWPTYLALGAIAHRQGRPDAAQQAYSAANALVSLLAEELPNPELRAGLLQGALARIPSRYGPSSRRARASQFDGLTTREVEVATLVAQGRSNREIAEALVIGDRTVETHISNIFAKLRVASRQEVAAWAVDKGLVA